jgi:hypothetical protein
LQNAHPKALKALGIAKKPIIAGLIAALFLVLSLINGIGYHITELWEVSYVPNLQEDYADVILRCNMTLNPLLYPYYWLKGLGIFEGDYPMIHIPALSFMTAQARLDNYIMLIITAGNLSNLVVFFLIAIAIELIGKRVIYIVLFSSIIGFAFAGITGTIAGMIAGIFPALLIAFKTPQGRILSRFWDSLWQSSKSETPEQNR